MKRQADFRGAGRMGSQSGTLLEVAAFSLCVYLTTTPFMFALTNQDPNVQMVLNISTMQQQNQSMLLVYGVRALVALIGGLFMIRHMRAVKSHLGQLRPILPFLLWAALSSIWSDNMGVSFRSVLTLAVLWMGAYLFAIRLSATTAARALVGGGAIIGLSCLAYALIDPYYAIHQITDSSQSVHAGAWRGVYQHKNFLGHVCAFFAAAVFWADRTTIPWWPLKWSLIALFIYLIVKSTSASSLPIIIITVAAVWTLIAADPKQRTKALIVFAPGVAALYYGTTMLLRAIGRDATFSGRTEIWQIAMDSILNRPLQGYGFVSITYGDFSYNLMQRAGVLDPHNGFLDIALGTGLIGLVLFLAILPFAWTSARRLFVAGGGERQVALMLSSLVIGWLVSSMTESSTRPLTAMGGIGLFALVAVLSIPRVRQAAPNPFAEMRLRAQQA